jgi:hypothetical protein
MNQPSLFDVVEPSPTAIGLARSADSARKWTDDEVRHVHNAIEACIRFLPEFTADDIWSRLPDTFPVTKGLASQLSLFARQGRIEATDRTRKSTRGGEHCHGQRLTIWRSL